jgi:hypothetical protein
MWRVYVLECRPLGSGIWRKQQAANGCKSCDYKNAKSFSALIMKHVRKGVKNLMPKML